ncbi:MAG TPA: hypothetical protein VN862_08915 [Candidatus Acidoferrales bacterium]|nr:hypothetical protein [Candidatus Acidoferrales bacterium]
MFCPVCKSEYQQGYTQCAECGVALVSSMPADDPSGAPQREPLVVLWRGQDPVAFSAILSALADAAIPYRESHSRDYAACLSQPFALSFYGLPHWQILVHPSDLDRGKSVAEEALKPVPAGPVELDGELPEDANPLKATASPAGGAQTPLCIWSAKDSSRGQSLRDVLLANDVPCWTISGSAGDIRLLVRREDEARAREVIGGAIAKEGAA